MSNDPSRYVQDESESNVSVDIIPQDENQSQYSDRRVYDNEGNYAPQGAVQMKFPDNFNEIVGESLREAQDTSARLDASMEGLLSDIRKELRIEQKHFSDRISTEEQLSTFNLEGKWNDYIGVQKEVIPVLRKEGFFDNNEVINEESGMIVRINSKGIKETLGSGKRFQTLPRELKEYKVATLRSLPNII